VAAALGMCVNPGITISTPLEIPRSERARANCGRTFRQRAVIMQVSHGDGWNLDVNIESILKRP
jgi:hypothetical protein